MPALLKRTTCFAYSLSLALVLPSTVDAASDPVGDFFRGIGRGIQQVLGGQDTPEVTAVKPRVTFPTQTAPINHSRFYLVKMVCSKAPNTANLISNGLAIKQETFVAHSLWFSPSAGDSSVPANPVKLVNAFSFTKDKDGVVADFDNQTCSDTFLLSGDNDVLTVSFLLASTKTTSSIVTAFGSATKLMTGVVPLFLGGPLAGVITGAAKAAGDTANPVKEIVEAFNKSPRKAVASLRLKATLDATKPIVVQTAYSTVKITVTPIDDLTQQITKDDNFYLAFKRLFSAITTPFQNGLTRANAVDHCAGFARKLVEDYKFSSKDQAFLIGYFATSASPADVDVRLSCVGARDLAQRIVTEKFPYNIAAGPSPAIQQQDIENHEWVSFGTKLSSAKANLYLEKLSALLPAYAQAPPAERDSAGTAVYNWVNVPQVLIEDPTTEISTTTSTSLATEILFGKLTDKFKRYGCFILDATVDIGPYDAILLAFPLTPEKGDVFEPEEIMGVHLMLAGSGKVDPPARIVKLGFTRNTNAILEAARKFPNGKCNKAKINTKTAQQ